MPKEWNQAVFQGSKNYKAVQIFKPDKGASYHLDKDALEEIFGQKEVADKPIAIYSIAGAYRTGKSFMLNLFLHFLKSDKSKNWLKDKHAELSQDFAWRGGSDRCTAGMWMWNEPFQLKTREGKTIVLFLIDTQGTFDNQTTLQQNSLIFAFSTLISSVQIYNLFRNIHESDLHNLNFFTNYARAVKDRSSDVEGKPFQKLVFLIRDYLVPTYRGFEGGNEVLENYFANKNNLEELQNTRNNCLQSFENTECFCASRPGDDVTERLDDTSPLKLTNIKPIFLNEVNDLVHHLFVDKIVPKRVNGKIATSTQLINLFIAYGDVFESGTVPNVDSILTATAKVGLITTAQRLSDWSYNALLQKSSSRCKNLETLKALFPELKNKALKEYDEMPKLGDKELAEKYRKHLSQLIDQRFRVVKQDNSQNLALLRGNIRKEKEKTLRIFLKKFEESIPKDLDPTTISENEQKFFKEALSYFKEKTKEFDSDVAEPFANKLKRQLRRRFAKQQERAQHHLQEIKMKLSAAAVDSKHLYSQGMERGCQGKSLDSKQFEETHQTHNNRALYEFDEFADGSNASMKEQKREELIQEIEKIKKIYQLANEENVNVLNITSKKTTKASYETIPKAINEVKKVYTESMAKKCGDNWLPSDRFKQAHQESLDQACSVIPDIQSKTAADECLKEMTSCLKSEFEKCQSLNELSRITVIHKMVCQSNEAQQHYKKKMANKIETANNKFLDDDEFKKYHNAQREKALEMYGKISQEPKEEFDKIKLTLERNIEAELEDFKFLNTENKEKAKEEANELIEVDKGKYLERMVKVYCDGYVKEDALRRAHELEKESLVEDFRKKYKELPKMLDQLKDDLEISFRAIQRDNEENKPFFLRRIGSLVLGRMFRQRGVAEFSTTGY